MMNSIESVVCDENASNTVVIVKDVSIRYSNRVNVLNNVNIQIPRGEIFALLGPNGCGKTTLIRAILGRITLNKGSIEVFGERPGSRHSSVPGIGVGYMPQELALFTQFTINEILKYYGLIYRIKSSELSKRIENLIEVLNLPEKSRSIDTLSGGQQRRVSIAVTLIHRPKLIVLDEPTVGVDSMLRQKLWQHLEYICKQYGQTVIITTHYIEEAKSASTVALMNSGSIMKTSNPQNLLQEYNCQTLEEVFLQVCQQKGKGKLQESGQITLDDLKTNKNINDILKKTNKSFNNNIDFNRILAMIWKYYILTKRNSMFICIYFTLPIVAIFLLQIVYNQDPNNLSVAIYNGEQNPRLSQVFLDSIDKTVFNLNQFKDNETAFESVLKGKSFMSIVFNDNFSDAFETRIKDIKTLLTAEDIDIEDSLIHINLDFTNGLIGYSIIKQIFQAFRKFLDTLSNILGFNVYQVMSPVQIKEVIYGNFKFRLTDQFISGTFLIFSQCLPVYLSAFQIVIDRENHSFERVFVSGVKPIEYFIAHMIQTSLLVIIQNIFEMFVIFYFLSPTQLGSYFDVYLMLVLQGLLGISMGLFVSILIADKISVSTVISLIMTPVWLTSGILWPIETFPSYMKFMSYISPITFPLESLRSVMLRGWALTQPTVLYGYVFTFVCFLGLTLINVFLFCKFNGKTFSLFKHNAIN